MRKMRICNSCNCYYSAEIRIMLVRYKLIIAITILTVVVMILSMCFLVDNEKKKNIDRYVTISAQREFLKDEFLHLESGDMQAIQFYIQILNVLSTKNISRKNIDVNKNSISNLEEFKEISNLLIKGAKLKTLGEFKYKDTLSVEVQDYSTLEIADLIIIPKIIRYSIENEPDKYKYFNRNILLAKSCIALGIQCLEYNDNSMFCLVGIVCKREGIEILKLYRQISEDKEFINEIDAISNEFVKEKNIIKKTTRDRIRRHTILNE